MNAVSMQNSFLNSSTWPV
uniref:Uncharacterized protein n=1 Tax=Anguilla anguilla TaxID=7936 RepID=A0A0E9V0Y1_ANGAN